MSLLTERVLLDNITQLLEARKLSQRDLASWMGHHETWISKIMSEDRGLRLKEIDRMASFFGLEGYQLLTPGISNLTERRRGDRRQGDRRAGKDRRLGPMRDIMQPRFPPRRRAAAGGDEA